MFHSKLGYPSVKDFSWIVQIKKIVDCTVTVQYIYITHAIFGKKIGFNKGDQYVEGEIVKVPKKLI